MFPFFNQPISAIFKPNRVTCFRKATVRKAARKMAKSDWKVDED